MFYDNMFAIVMSKNLVFHAWLKYIELRHHFIKNIIEKYEIELKFINIKVQMTDVFIKALTKDKFEYFTKTMKISN